jgi:Na+/H+ antiporter NhaA
MAQPLAGRTAWARNVQTPLRAFLATETGSAAVLLGATLAALIWVNVAGRSYAAVWDTELTIRVGRWAIGQDLREWVNSGLMTLFFFVVGLEARREFDLGELRDRSRLAGPLLAGVAGMVVPVIIFLAINSADGGARGWGAAMSTDTAFALGLLALVGPRFPDRLRSFLLTVAVVDDLVALIVIATAYTEHLVLMALLMGLAVFGVILAVRALPVRAPGAFYAVLGLVCWVAVHGSGVDPVVVGLAMGLITYAYPAARGDLERASDLFRLFREQPTPELAREAREGVASAISPNERLQLLYHPWTSYVFVPLFALANAGIPISGAFLARAFTSPITIGIIVAYLVGKPIGIGGVTWLVAKLSRGRLSPPVGWAAVAGAGTIAGIGFTVSLLVSTLAFTGDRLQEAKVGVLTAALLSAVLTLVLFRATNLMPLPRRTRALLGTAELLTDLAAPVDPDRDHIRGPAEAPVTVVEYGDFECPYCGQAEPVVRKLLADFGDVRYVWRHLPLNDVHPHAQQAAEASEAAAEQGQFWAMHDTLLGHQGELTGRDLVRYATDLGLDVDAFRDAVRTRAGASRVAADVDSADLSGVSGTPTFFINGRRHQGAYDIETLSHEVKAARARAAIAASS